MKHLKTFNEALSGNTIQRVSEIIEDGVDNSEDRDTTRDDEIVRTILSSFGEERITRGDVVRWKNAKQLKLKNDPELAEIFKQYGYGDDFVTALEEEQLLLNNIVRELDIGYGRDFKKEDKNTKQLISTLEYLSKMPKVFDKFIDSLYNYVVHNEGETEYIFLRFIHPMDNNGQWGLKLRTTNSRIHGEQRPVYFDVDKVNRYVIDSIIKKIHEVSNTSNVMKKINKQ